MLRTRLRAVIVGGVLVLTLAGAVAAAGSTLTTVPVPHPHATSSHVAPARPPARPSNLLPLAIAAVLLFAARRPPLRVALATSSDHRASRLAFLVSRSNRAPPPPAPPLGGRDG